MKRWSRGKVPGTWTRGICGVLLLRVYRRKCPRRHIWYVYGVNRVGRGEAATAHAAKLMATRHARRMLGKMQSEL